MKKPTLWVVLLVIVGIGVLVALNMPLKSTTEAGLTDDYKAITFTMSGTPVALIEGSAEAVTNLGGSEKTMVRYFGNELAHDVDGDGKEDVVFLITQEVGEHMYFYAVAALKRESGYLGSKAVLLGDHIAPQPTNKGDGREIIVNFAQRKPGEPLDARPSYGKSIWLLLDPQTLEFGEVIKNFEGETR